MCGIAGYVDLRAERPADRDLLVRMTGKLAHRGPDSDGFFVENEVGLGFRRLSIVDLATGDQPIYNEDRSVVLLCNGEITFSISFTEQGTDKLHGFTEKYLLKALAGDLLPVEIIDREKFGFRAPGTPFLLRRNIEWIEDLLSHERIKRQGYFNPDAVQMLRRRYLEDGEFNPHLETDFLKAILTLVSSVTSSLCRPGVIHLKGCLTSMLFQGGNR